MEGFGEAARLWIEYCCADGSAKMTAWTALITFLRTNPAAFEAVVSNGIINDAAVATLRSAVARAIATRVAVQGLASDLVVESVSMRFIVMRLGASLAGAPKIPLPPQAQMAIALAIIIGSTGQAFAEGSARQAASGAYQQYRMRYFEFLLKISRIHPKQMERLQPPMSFDEWYVANGS